MQIQYFILDFHTELCWRTCRFCELQYLLSSNSQNHLGKASMSANKYTNRAQTEDCELDWLQLISIFHLFYRFVIPTETETEFRFQTRFRFRMSAASINWIASREYSVGLAGATESFPYRRAVASIDNKRLLSSMTQVDYLARHASSRRRLLANQTIYEKIWQISIIHICT